MSQVFYLNSDVEKDAVAKQLQFLFDNKLITKVTSFTQVVKKFVAVANFIFKS